MPKLTPLQWLLFAVFFAFYGLAVFALTRDYYVRHPVRVAPARVPAAPHGMASPDGRMPSASAVESFSSVPETITETNPTLLRQRAEALFGQQQYAEAVTLYRRILELAPDDIEAYNDLGLALHYQGDSTRALEVLREGSKKGADFQRVWLTLGFVALQAGDETQAREALERARSLGSDNEIGQEAARLIGLLKQ